MAVLVWSAMVRADELERRLLLLRDNFQNAPPVHFRSKTTCQFYYTAGKDPDRTVAVDYEYWGKEQQYRINCASQGKDAADSKSSQLAYDGQRFFRLNGNSSTLTYRKRDMAIAPEMPDNALLFPVQFITPEGSGSGRRLRFKDVNDNENWNRILKAAKVVSDADGKMIVELPGDVGDGLDGVFRVHFAGSPDFMPTLVERIANKGQLHVRYAINEYVAAQANGRTTYWPKSVAFEAVLDGKKQIASSTEIAAMDVGKEPPPEVFSIDPALADTVVDDDSGLAVKYPKMFRPDKASVSIAVNESLAANDNAGKAQSATPAPDHAAAHTSPQAQADDASNPAHGNRRSYAVYAAIVCAVLAAAGAVLLFRQWRKSA
jgi:hypothetical protein